MIHPIALKYDDNGVLQFVRCFYFEVDTRLCPSVYAICLAVNASRQNFFNHTILERHISSLMNETYLQTKYLAQTRPVTPDSLYDFAVDVPFRAINMQNTRVFDMPAQEYLVKYGNILRANSLAILDCNDNLIYDAVQAIVPKITVYTVDWVSTSNWEINQDAIVVPDNFVLRCDPETRNEYVNRRLFKLPIEGKDIKGNTTIYLIDYKGSILKMPIEKALDLGVKIGNLTPTSGIRLEQQPTQKELETRHKQKLAWEMSKRKRYPAIDNKDKIFEDAYRANGNGYRILEAWLKASKFNQTEQLKAQGNMHGIPDVPKHYQAAIPPSATNAIIPSAEQIVLEIPDDYRLQNIRFGEIIESFKLRCKHPLDTVILPRFIENCDIIMQSARVLQLPRLLFGNSTIHIHDYYGQIIEMETQDNAKISIDNAPALTMANFLINNPITPDQKSYQSLYEDTDNKDYLDIKIHNAYNLASLTISQRDEIRSNYGVIIDASKMGNVTIAIAGNIPYLKIKMADNPNQIINVLTKYTIYRVDIVAKFGSCGVINFQARNSNIRLCDTAVYDTDGSLKQSYSIREDGSLYLLFPPPAGIPRVTITGYAPSHV